MSDYYEILGIEKNASKDEIKSAFRKMARKWHPDVNKAPEAEAKFKELGKAYETLMDDEKRATYDRFGEDGLKNAGFNTQGPFAGGFGDLDEVFNSFFGGFGFGGGSRRADPNAPQRGDDLRLDIEIEFEEAVFGLTKEIKIAHLVKVQVQKRVQNLKFVKLAAEAVLSSKPQERFWVILLKLLPARIVMVKVL